MNADFTLLIFNFGNFGNPSNTHYGDTEAPSYGVMQQI
jgi:hypothetical protein